MSRIVDLMNLYRVPRWSLVTTLRNQSVAEHSFNVAAIALEICDRLGWWKEPMTRGRVGRIMLWAIVHDGPEAQTGDIPYPVKKFPGMKDKCDVIEAHLSPWQMQYDVAVTSDERAIVKIADKIEGYLWLEKFGLGDDAGMAMHGAYQQILSHVEEARSRYSWPDLPSIVSDLLGTTPTVTDSPPTQPGPSQPSPVQAQVPVPPSEA